MRLRPRYSLLTLLVLTALVAGGVKLWYGPHRAKERKNSTTEIEYTYTRDWRGNKLINGPHITRTLHPNGLIYKVYLQYYLHGTQTKHEQSMISLSKNEMLHDQNFRPKPPALPESDKESFQHAIAEEADKIRASGFRPGFTMYIDWDIPEVEQLKDGTWVMKEKRPQE